MVFKILSWETGDLTLDIHYYRARVDVNAVLDGSASCLSRLDNIRMLIAPQWIGVLTRWMLACILSYTVSCVVSGARASALLVWLSSVIDLLWMPRRWWQVGMAASTGLIGSDQIWVANIGIIKIIRTTRGVFHRFGGGESNIMFLISTFLRLPCMSLLVLSFKLLGDCKSCWYTRWTDSLDFAFGSRYYRFRGMRASFVVGFPTDDHGQLIWRNGIRYLSLIGSNPVIMVMFIPRDEFCSV